ncbi:F-box protein CPR1-like [Tripterygium wilfordii]|uniref:F-box protein CPR1-like n=1 Tax=Tripterygium wilfordii TaxID=458696 RepID=UPI0018F80E62|nr:F-box protein CPR1-like [Tripterygium wilfordii]
MAENKSKRMISRWEPKSGVEEIPNLPVELVADILLRLSATLLLCCRRVCKVWCKIIDSPSFVNTHRTRHGSNESELLFLKTPTHRRDTMKVYSLKADNFNHTVNMSRYPIAEFVNPYNRTSSGYGYSCYWDYLSNYLGYGLFLFRSKSCEERVFLYNPLREEVLILPPVPTEGSDRTPDYYWNNGIVINTFCMGFDSATNEYKIVHTYNVDSRGDYKSISNSMVTNIYTLGTSTWRKITAVPPVLPDTEAVPAYGDVHWRIVTTTFSPEFNIHEEMLLSFDLKKEEYKYTTLPAVHHERRRFTLFNLKEFLAISDVICDYDYDSDTGTMGLDIWILKDYENQEWVKQYTINNVAGLNVIGAWQDGVMLFSGFRYSEIFYYDPETDSLSTMVSPSNSYDGTIISCATSLMSLKNYGDLKSKRVSRGRGTYYFNLNKANT